MNNRQRPDCDREQTPFARGFRQGYRPALLSHTCLSQQKIIQIQLKQLAAQTAVLELGDALVAAGAKAVGEAMRDNAAQLSLEAEAVIRALSESPKNHG